MSINQMITMHAALGERDDEIAHLRATLTERDRVIATLDAHQAAQHAEIERLRIENAIFRQALHSIRKVAENAFMGSWRFQVADLVDDAFASAPPPAPRSQRQSQTEAT